MEAPTGFEPVMGALQAPALPLGYGAKGGIIAGGRSACQEKPLFSCGLLGFVARSGRETVGQRDRGIEG